MAQSYQPTEPLELALQRQKAHSGGHRMQCIIKHNLVATTIIGSDQMTAAWSPKHKKVSSKPWMGRQKEWEDQGSFLGGGGEGMDGTRG